MAEPGPKALRQIFEQGYKSSAGDKNPHPAIHEVKTRMLANPAHFAWSAGYQFKAAVELYENQQPTEAPA